ncbi:carbohydrate esterase family 4 protein [Infundibulicybe gibba]|nr:carbohydrate esterase family 4 protein [Infundibulicybe gibba]
MLVQSFITLALSLASASIVSASPAKRFPGQVITACTVPNTVALTFDDGPNVYIHDIVNALDEVGAKGTFFFNGNNFGCIYNRAEGVKYAYDHGHQVASHTWSHAHLNNLNRVQVDDEFARVELALQRITGAVPAFMRPPYGEHNDQVDSVARDRGQAVTLWDFDSGDSTGASPDESKTRYDDVVNRHPSTLLALNHETSETTAHDVLPYAIKKLQGAGYQLVTVAECVGQSPYQSVGLPQAGNWQC